MAMSFNTKGLTNIAAKLISNEVNEIEKYEILKSILNEPITIDQLQKSRIGKSVKKCSKIEGCIGKVAHKLIDKWAQMIEQYYKKDTSSKNIDFETTQRKTESVSTPKKHKKHEENREIDNNNNKDHENNMESFNDLFSTNTSTIKSIKASKPSKIDKSLKIDKSSKIEKKSIVNTTEINNIDNCDIGNPKKRMSTSETPKNEKKLKEFGFIPSELPELPPLNLEEDSDNNQSNVRNRSDLAVMEKNNLPEKNNLDDIDVTSKYASQKKVWVPKSRNAAPLGGTESPPAECEYINNVPVSEIASYSAKQLTDFEGDDRKIMKKTNTFWQKLFIKNYKFESKFEDEKWRDAYRRLMIDEEKKLREISEKLNKKAELNKRNESRAMMINVPLKTTGQRRYGGGNNRR